jgi:hypothetical protein
MLGYGGDEGCMNCTSGLRAAISNLEAVDDALIANTIRYRSSTGAHNAACNGDSGGPVFARGPQGDSVLVGLTWGADTLDASSGCKDWGLDGDLRDYQAWIGPNAPPPSPQAVPVSLGHAGLFAVLVLAVWFGQRRSSPRRRPSE